MGTTPAAMPMPPIELAASHLLARRRQIRRLLIALLVVLTLAGPAIGLPGAWEAFGLGLLLPGGGLLYTGDPVLFVVVAVVTAALLPRMMTRGDYLSGPVVALAGAGLAAWRSDAHDWTWAAWLVPGIWILAAVLMLIRALRTGPEARRTRERRDALVSASPRTAADPVPVGSVAELTTDELAFHRWMLDHGLRAPDDWSSLDMVDQFTLRSVRYQLNFLQWSLALATHLHTPAFAGYNHVAQRNLIERVTDARVWSYWRWENRWGNLRMSADPIAWDNIMFSGYLALMLGTYVATTGDRRYDQSGSLTFARDGEPAFVYDHERLVEAIEENFRRSPYGLYSCEPGFIFPLCNTVAMLGLAARDVQSGSARREALEPDFLRGLRDEFTHPDGDINFIVNSRLGVGVGHSAHVSAQLGFFLHPLAPALTERWWTIARSELIDSGRYRPEKLTGKGDPATGDWGTGKPSHAAMYTAVLALAREMGDSEAYDAVLEAADEHLGWTVRDGVGCYERCSVNANALLGTARFGGAGAFRRLVLAGVPDAGPRLAAAAYPEVLVAKAVSDGQDLQLVLLPGDGGGRTTLRFEGLRPRAPYSVSNGVVHEAHADASGQVTIDVDLGTRTPLTIAPQL